MKSGRVVRDERGFTLIEIIAVLVVLGVLAAVAIPKYMNLTNDARNKAAMGQVAEVKGRLSAALSGYMLKNDGTVPATGALLLTYANGVTANACPTTDTLEGDFNFKCTAGDGQKITISVSKVQTNDLKTSDGTVTPVTGDFTWQ